MLGLNTDNYGSCTSGASSILGVGDYSTTADITFNLNPGLYEMQIFLVNIQMLLSDPLALDAVAITDYQCYLLPASETMMPYDNYELLTAPILSYNRPLLRGYTPLNLYVRNMGAGANSFIVRSTIYLNASLASVYTLSAQATVFFKSLGRS